MRAIDRKLWRDLWRLRGQGAAIALVIATGVAIFVMALSAIDSLRLAQDTYYARGQFADVFAHATRAPLRVAEQAAAIPGVATADARIVADGVLDAAGDPEPITVRVATLPRRDGSALNQLVLRSGQWPLAGRDDHVLVNESFATARGLTVGDSLDVTVKGQRQTYVMVGTALSPEYVYAVGPGGLVPDDTRFGIVWAQRDALEAALDLDGAFNDLAVKLQPGIDAAPVIDVLDDLLAKWGGTGAYDRDSQISHVFLTGELDQLAATARVVPPIFLAVAVFMLNMVVARVVDLERRQIGLLKAFGYRNRDVLDHYMKMVMAVTLIGSLLGCGAGLWLGRALTGLYTDFFHFPFLLYRPTLSSLVVGVALCLAASAVATIVVARRAAMLPPAVAMAPRVPPRYGQTIIERLRLLDFVDEPTRIVVRNLVRRPWRSALTCLAMAMAVALLTGTLFMVDAVDEMLDLAFNRIQHQDVTVRLAEPRDLRALRALEHMPGVLLAEPTRDVAVTIAAGPRSKRVGLTGLPPNSRLTRPVDANQQPLVLPERGIVLSTWLAGTLEVTVGDVVSVRAHEGRQRQADIHVAQVSEEYVGSGATMSLAAVNELMGEDVVLTAAQLRVDMTEIDRFFAAAKDAPMVSGVALKSATLEKINETAGENLLRMTMFLTGFGGLIALGVASNNARISLSEGAQAFASLRVLGFTTAEVASVLVGEVVVLALLAVPIGVGLGTGLARLNKAGMDTEMFRLPMIIEHSTYGFSAGVMLVAVALACIGAWRRVGKLDLSTALKSRE